MTPITYTLEVRPSGTTLRMLSAYRLGNWPDGYVKQFLDAGDALAWLAHVLGYSDIDERAKRILDTIVDRVGDEVAR